MTVSPRFPPEVKKKVVKLAQAQDTTAHAFMLAAIREKVEAEAARAEFDAEGKRRLTRMKRSGLAIPAAEVFDYLERRALGKSAVRPKARGIACVIVFDAEALEDLERIFEFSFARDPATALDHIRRIREGISILANHPEIGRVVAGSPLRELAISHAASGCIALYQHAPLERLVRVAAVRHQREAG